LLFIESGGDIPVEDDLAFIEVNRRGAVWTGEKDLPNFWVKFAAALRASDARGYLWILHVLIIADGRQFKGIKLL